ncbi:MAG: lysylphosphatidylglycerol synthase transmembrane domain-containing protein [Planctomycetota bacterium]
MAFFKIAISVAILSWLFNKAIQGNQFELIAGREKNWLWIFIAFAFCVAAHLFSFVRWRFLVRALDIPFSVLDAIRIGMVGIFFGLFMFGIVGGDSIRMYYAARNAKHKLAQVVCSVFADRIIGMLSMFTFATIGFWFVDLETTDVADPEMLAGIQFLCQLVMLMTTIGWLAVIACLVTPLHWTTKVFTWLKKVPKVGEQFAKIEDVFQLYRSRLGAIAICFVLSGLVNLCFIVSIYFVAAGLNVPHPSLAQHVVVAPISMTANAVPLPGGIGGMEVVLSYLYEGMTGANKEGQFGISVAFLFRFMLLSLAAMGAFAWFVARKQMKALVSDERNSTA